MQSSISELLTKKQKYRLEKLHRQMRQSAKSISEALKEIKADKLYREYGTFEEYCQKEWNLTPQHANRMLAFEAVKDNLKSEPMGSLLTNERQARPLTKLEPAKQAEALERAVESANGKKPTAVQVADAVEDLEIPDAEEPKDIAGCVIPVKARKAFENAPAIEKIWRQIGATVGPLKDMMDAATPGTEILCKNNLVMEYARQLRRAIHLNIPHAVCPYCDGLKDTCDGCNGRGWVNAGTYDAGKSQRESHSQLKARLEKR